MDKRELAAHESLDLHEIINFKTLCVAKSKLMQGLVFDQDLKTLMEKDVQQASQDLADLQAVYERASFQAPVPQTGRLRSSIERKVSIVES